MPEIVHFRESDKIIKRIGLDVDVNITLEYVEAMLHGTLYKRELTIQALKDCDWREGDLSIIDGRRYQYKGLKVGWPSRAILPLMNTSWKVFSVFKLDLTREGSKPES